MSAQGPPPCTQGTTFSPLSEPQAPRLAPGNTLPRIGRLSEPEPMSRCTFQASPVPGQGEGWIRAPFHFLSKTQLPPITSPQRCTFSSQRLTPTDPSPAPRPVPALGPGSPCPAPVSVTAGSPSRVGSCSVGASVTRLRLLAASSRPIGVTVRDATARDCPAKGEGQPAGRTRPGVPVQRRDHHSY